MATNTTTPATTDVPALDPAADAVTHDRGTTPVGNGRITFKGHNAKAGYPFRIYEGQVQALVDGAWVEAEDAAAI
jgi:hypothetical protein